MTANNCTLLPPAIADIWHCLRQIADPELPVLSITDLGMVRAVNATPSGWCITFTPSYSGCPATEFLITEIKQTLATAGYTEVEVKISLTPPWSSDWINPEARQRLREYGIAPPQGSACDRPVTPLAIICPRCHSTDTEKISEFGSTACKAHYRCCNCLEPFDYFKCI